ncbi:lanthionine synthetase LanC family protein [Flavobacterium gelatinilyticum]|uniref:lanthionine synthetase LanC family protein n=1 Tax=Flavobacterium gelatinilyticum TaxID=3003260 RepID=UPI0024813E55|nr:lanthionine synthetase LanC family protein [Flavobacterium gelatinilyticum]
MNQALVEEMDSLFKKIDKILFASAKKMSNPVINHDLGVLIYFAARYKINKEQLYKKRCIYLLNKFVAIFNDHEFSRGSFDGFESVFLTIEYLKKCEIIDDASSFLEELEDNLYQSIMNDIEENMFEVFYGSIGKIQYFLDEDKIKEDKISNLINLFVNSLWESRKEIEGQIYWIDKVKYDEKLEVIDLGMAHGICSVLIFFVKLKELQFSNPYLDNLISGLIKTFKNAENAVKGTSFFPDVYSIKNKHLNLINSRPAYCVGDLPISYAFCYAGRVLNNEDLIQYSKKIIKVNAHATVSTSSLYYFEEHDFFDIGFCHGISSFLFLFHKINRYHENDFIDFKIEYWKKELIKNISKIIKIKGTIYYSHPYNEVRYKVPVNKNSFLNGLSGAALALLAIEYNETDWSRFLCLNE